jgi:hypothetical protein
VLPHVTYVVGKFWFKLNTRVQPGQFDSAIVYTTKKGMLMLAMTFSDLGRLELRICSFFQLKLLSTLNCHNNTAGKKKRCYAPECN